MSITKISRPDTSHLIIRLALPERNTPYHDLTAYSRHIGYLRDSRATRRMPEFAPDQALVTGDVWDLFDQRRALPDIRSCTRRRNAWSKNTMGRKLEFWIDSSVKLLRCNLLDKLVIVEASNREVHLLEKNIGTIFTLALFCIISPNYVLAQQTDGFVSLDAMSPDGVHTWEQFGKIARRDRQEDTARSICRGPSSEACDRALLTLTRLTLAAYPTATPAELTTYMKRSFSLIMFEVRYSTRLTREEMRQRLSHLQDMNRQTVPELYDRLSASPS